MITYTLLRDTLRVVTLALMLIVGITGISRADEPALHGVFTNPSQSDEPIKYGIEAAVKDLNFIVRSIARSRLKKTNSALKRVEIVRDGAMIKIVLGSETPTITEPGHPAVKWTRQDGEVFDVSTEWEANTLLERIAAKDGQRENRFSISPDGVTLTMHVTLRSPQLKAPVQYQLNFTKVETK